MHRPLKDAMDAVDPRFRQSAHIHEPMPRLLVFQLDGVVHVAADCVSNRAFGAGHLSSDRYWAEGGPGACLKTDTSALDAIDAEGPIPGFLHFQRFGFPNTTVPSGLCGVEGDAKHFFAEHVGEYSYFIEVEFVRDGTPMYPWRCRRRR